MEPVSESVKTAIPPRTIAAFLAVLLAGCNAASPNPSLPNAAASLHESFAKSLPQGIGVRPGSSSASGSRTNALRVGAITSRPPPKV